MSKFQVSTTEIQQFEMFILNITPEIQDFQDAKSIRIIAIMILSSLASGVNHRTIFRHKEHAQVS